MYARGIAFWATLGLSLLSASLASAAPISFDGLIDGNDSYLATITDDANDVPDADWDIKTARFDLYGGWLWMGLEVQTGPIDTDGDHGSILSRTLIYASLDTSWKLSQPLYIGMDANGIAGVMLNGAWLVKGTEYDAALGSGPTGGLELKIDATKVFGPSYSVPQNLSFVLQLDDTGQHGDDQITGLVRVPEPAVAVLLSVGLPLVLARRKRR